MAKYNNIVGVDASKENILKNFQKVADIVGATMGIGGRPIIIQGGLGEGNLITKDGVTVARSIKPSKQDDRLAVELIVQAAREANARGGDGTTTATVLTNALTKFLLGLPSDRQLLVSNLLKNEITPDIIELVRVSCIPGNDYSVLKKATTISANGDTALANMVVEAIWNSCGDAEITVVGSKEGVDKITRQDAISIGIATTLFDATVKDEYRFVLFNDIIDESNVNNIKGSNNGHCILIVPRIEGNLSRTLNTVFKRGVTVVALNSTISVSNKLISDISNVTGIPEIGKLEELKDVLTTSERGLLTATISPKYINIDVTEAIDTRRMALVNDLNSILANKPDKRTANITTQRLRVISPYLYTLELVTVTDYEHGERLARAEDCINACRNTYKEGIIVGGGIAALAAFGALANAEKLPSVLTTEEVWGLVVAFLAPVNQIRKNMGLCEVADIEDGKFLTSLTKSYNVVTDKMEPLTETNIVDPTTVFISALSSATSLATTVATTGGSLVLETYYEE